MTTIAVLGALDTKREEIEFLARSVTAAGATPVLVDTSASGTNDVAADRSAGRSAGATVGADEVAAAAGSSLAALRSMDRAEAVRTMARGAASRLADLDVDGLVAAGGSNAAVVFATAAATLPFGVPKVIATTMVVVDAAAVVGDLDVTVLYPVADIEGLNSLTEPVLRQAAAAVVAMASVSGSRVAPPDRPRRPVIAATMFGVTTACVHAVREELESNGDEVIVFHANGTGGRSVEALADAGRFDAIVDVTTTELADLVAGGDLDAGDRRLAPDRGVGVPRVVVPGACDMANFGPLAAVPEQFSGRNLYVHNDNVTLMRTNVDENVRIGALIGRFLAARDDCVGLIPLRGLSALDREGGPFWDPDADAALFDAMHTTGANVIDVDAHVNDAQFAAAVVEHLSALRRR